VRNIARRVTFALTAMIVAAAVSSTPAYAAGNPYSAAEACSKTANGDWRQVVGGTAIKAGGTTVGEVFLMRDKPAGKYCAATIKRVDIGKATATSVLVENGNDVRRDSGDFEYFAAAILESRSVCIYYHGAVNGHSSEARAYCP
jgi:hypothetical protein